MPDKRGDALGVTAEPAVAARQRLAVEQQPVHRDVHVPELARHPGRALDDPAALDHAAAEAGPDDRRDRRALARDGAEVAVVGVQGGGVAVVVVDDRQPELVLERGTHVEAVPLRVGEVGARRAS